MHQGIPPGRPGPVGGTRPGTWCDLGGRSDDGDTTTGGDVAEPSFGGARAGIIPDNAPPKQHARVLGLVGWRGSAGAGSPRGLAGGQGARKGSTTLRKSWVFSIMVQ